MKFLKRYVLIAATVSALAMEAFGPVEAAEKIVIHVYPGSLISLYAHLGKDLGFYEQQGLSAELLALASGPDATAALAGGSIDFVLNTSDNLILAHARGMPVVSVVGNQVRNFYSLVRQSDIEKKEEGSEVMADTLKGKRIGVNAVGTNGERFVRAIIRDVGLARDDAALVPVGGPPSALAAFAAKSVDMAFMWEPFQTITTMTGKGKILMDCRLDGQCPEQLEKPGRAFQSYFTSKAFLKTNPEAVEGFARAHVKINEWVHDPANRDKLIAEVKKLLPPPAALNLDADEYAKRIIETSLPAFGVTIDPAGLEAWNKQLLEAGLISRAVDTDEIVWKNAPRP